jgi:CRISPR type IV-associated protein Csf3
MICLAELKPYDERYAQLKMQSLRIVARLMPGSEIVAYDPVHLDNLLAKCVVNEATHGAGLPDSNEPYLLPVPLQRLWSDDQGLPLWASTVFIPVGISDRDIVYYHKRTITGRWTLSSSKRFNIKSSAGRHMERRIPLPTVLALEWEAFCVGNPDEIARLLRNVRHLGKRRAIGFGEIAEWCIEPADNWSISRSGLLLRPVPQQAARELKIHCLDAPQLIGWTPPQWKPNLFALGYPFGSTVDEDGK